MASVFPRVFGRELPRIVRGEGALLFDSDGKRYIDGSGGAVVVNIGHGRREVAEAMARQASAVAYVHGTQFSTAVLDSYAERLAAYAPGGARRLYPVSGGSEANETAIKLARAYHVARGEDARSKVVRRSISYHGNTVATLSASGRDALRAPYKPLLGPTVSTPAPFCYHCPLSLTFPGCGIACETEFERIVLREGPGTIAAYIAEPVIGASAGAAVPPDEYNRRARETCRRHGIVYIDDEVMTGFGRTGRFFAAEWSGLEPDIVTCGKGMAGGYVAAGGVLASEAIVAAVKDAGGFVHGFTFSHNPVMAAAASATLDILEREGLVARAEEMGERLAARLETLRRHEVVGDLRGRGLLRGIELVAERAGAVPFPRARKLVEEVQRKAFARGLVTYSGTGVANGCDGDALLLAPPFVIAESELDEAVAILDDVLEEVRP